MLDDLRQLLNEMEQVGKRVERYRGKQGSVEVSPDSFNRLCLFDAKAVPVTDVRRISFSEYCRMADEFTDQIARRLKLDKVCRKLGGHDEENDKADDKDKHDD